MQRVRMSLPYFSQFGWEAEVVTIDPQYADFPKDDLLLETVPSQIKIHKVAAFNKKITSKLGLGSIALRSLWFYKKTVNKLLKSSKFDLIYFSTTQFPVCVLGAYWKKKFGVPYVIDMQDPWHSNYYRNKPKHQRPRKYWFSYRLNKLMEPMAMNRVDGLISVSDDYIKTLQQRYPATQNIPTSTITFGAFAPDNIIAQKHANDFPNLLDANTINLVYVGRGGTDMHKAIEPVFQAFKQAQKDNLQVNRIRLYFIGTSYAPAGKGIKTIMPLAERCQVADQVIELTNRVGFYQALAILQAADALFIPGSDDAQYTASKLYPYLLTDKPLLAVFHLASSALKILKEYGAENSYSFNNLPSEKLIAFFNALAANALTQPVHNPAAIEKYAAEQMTMQQCQLFDSVINYNRHNA